MTVNGPSLYIGIDCGTSGVRVVAIDADNVAVAQASAAMADFGNDPRRPAVWRAAMDAAFTQMATTIDLTTVRAIAIDGTSGTMLPVDGAGNPVGSALMYNDPVDDASILGAISAVAPTSSAVHGATSGLARFISLQGSEGTVKILHQADWLAGQFSGRFDVSDENNALKTGYDSLQRCWPDWLANTGANTDLLPSVAAPGTITGPITKTAVEFYGLRASVCIVAGTTDGCASFMATGASQPGDAVTALGTTLTVKMLCDEAIFAPQFGLYSHRLGDRWLAGGASNSGGNVLLHYFAPDRIETLSQTIELTLDTGLNYYPLIKPGERFPVNDPEFPGHIGPQPADDGLFLQALFEGMADIETMAYQRLAELGAPALRCISAVGGGAKNPAWTAIRQRKLDVPFAAVLSADAAFGTALLARSAAAP